jgi:excisionase family DNA binding protein
MNSELLTVPEAAALLRLKPSTIRAWVCQHRIPFVKLGRLVRIRRRDIEALIAGSVVPPLAGYPTGTKLEPKVLSNAEAWERQQPVSQ